MKVKLYKFINGAVRLVDYGVKSQMNTYAMCGFTVVIDYSDKKERIWKRPITT